MTVKSYSISELAKEFDVTARAIRLYEESGLLAPERDGNRRIYRERDRVRLRLTLRSKRIGFSLAQVKEMFDLYDSKPVEGEKQQILFLLDIMDKRLDELKLQREELELTVVDIESVCSRARDSLTELEHTLNKSS
ncbi:MerR family transcriptional regulator [Leucothrix arctica]|uniref:MerR family transcriptional regulator n=1 Tax=Leucothrix arctica TaxID=1481894 RepID=A0A317CJ06_9GAMM|nr:MerR family DNA-binding transcriptional regulator [Leucothrix arctica]PWQ96310.1 MerR family transcriptional regulator [Leucothrix arctica]